MICYVAQNTGFAAMSGMAKRPGVRKLNVRAILLVAIAFTGSSSTTEAQGESDDSIKSRPPQINACALLSSAAVSEVTGFAAHSGKRRDSGYQANGAYSSTCVWILERDTPDTNQTSALGGRSFVILNVMRWPEGSGHARNFLGAFYEAAASGEIPSEPAPREFGDAALWWGDGLAVRKGDVSFGISVVIPGIQPDQPGELEGWLAPKILRRLENGDE
ncbi:MAG: hypothetical protein U5K76_09235 [Woeseiaceae bacterium]|nr:hypothetical protein [Woeseiaceae bacterium]